jgi:homoserine dehydrogenase
MVQNLFVLGATGRVGSTLVRQIFKKGDVDLNLHKNITRIVGLASSKKYVFNKKGLSEKECLCFIDNKESLIEYESVDELLSEAQKVLLRGEDELVFVDATGSQNVFPFHKKIIDETNFGIVTANKVPLTVCEPSDFKFLTKEPSRYGYRCSVMAGAGAINFLQDLQDVNDKAKRIKGCFSGTLGYLCSSLEEGKKLSEAIFEAKKQGYTEPHPRDDLSGIDVARKLLILARTAGYYVDLKEVDLTPFIPGKFLQIDDVTEFLSMLKKLDDEYAEKVKNASAKGNVLRYVAELTQSNESVSLKASLQEVPKNSPLGLLKGTANKIVIVSQTYPEENPYIIESPGAGLELTAQNIRRDLLGQLGTKRTLIMSSGK